MNPKDDYPGLSSFLRRGAERLETSDVKVFERYRKPRVRDLVPLQGSIQKDDTDWKITVGDGFVIPRHNASGDTGAPITITDLPIEGAELTVVATDKCYVKLNISILGKVTTATFEKASTWPTDTPPVLAGGDLAGTVGTRHIRILEVVEETTGFLVVEQIHTGHIDHFQPTLGENLTTSPGSNEARVLQQWNAAAGRWDYRYLVAGEGIGITENTNTIEVRATFTHQWKATAATATTLDVLGGKLTSQAGFAQAEIAGVAGLAVAASGYVILTVTRDSASREVTGTPTITYIAGEPASSDYTDQIIPLSKVTFGGGAITAITPLKFEELHIFEDLAVVNGEFRLADLLIASRNIYELPP